MIIYKTTVVAILFLVIFVVPMLVQFNSVGVNFPGNRFVLEIAYITTPSGVFDHLFHNMAGYFNILSNAIFWFFVVAFVAQKTMYWIMADD